MAGRFGVPFFEPYFQKLEVEAFKREAKGDRGLVQQMLEEVVREQRSRLRAIREKGPWEAEREIAEREQTERAYQTLARLKRFRELASRIQALEDALPPATGLGRLRYLNPFTLIYGLTGITVVVNVMSWIR